MMHGARPWRTQMKDVPPSPRCCLTRLQPCPCCWRPSPRDPAGWALCLLPLVAATEIAGKGSQNYPSPVDPSVSPFKAFRRGPTFFRGPLSLPLLLHPNKSQEAPHPDPDPPGWGQCPLPACPHCPQSPSQHLSVTSQTVPFVNREAGTQCLARCCIHSMVTVSDAQ